MNTSPEHVYRIGSASNDHSPHKYTSQRPIAGKITENAGRVLTHVAKLSIDQSVELTADVLFLVFFYKISKEGGPGPNTIPQHRSYHTTTA